MRRVCAFTCLAAILLIGSSNDSSDTVHVSGIIDGKVLRLSHHMQHKLAKESLRLLSSCTYANLRPTDAYASTIAHAEENSHLNVTFSESRFVQLSVRKNEVPSGKVDLRFQEMLIKLPLRAGAILVRSNNETLYFAKFDCPLSQELEKTLRKAQRR